MGGGDRDPEPAADGPLRVLGRGPDRGSRRFGSGRCAPPWRPGLASRGGGRRPGLPPGRVPGRISVHRRAAAVGAGARGSGEAFNGYGETRLMKPLVVVLLIVLMDLMGFTIVI